jgi:hypothetical protein
MAIRGIIQVAEIDSGVPENVIEAVVRPQWGGIQLIFRDRSCLSSTSLKVYNGVPFHEVATHPVA